MPHPLGLTNPGQVASYACLNERMTVATHYHDEELLGCLGMVHDIHWLFARGGMGQFIELKKHTYRDLSLEFLTTLHDKVTSGPQYQGGCIPFYLQGQFYELNLGTFDNIFGFPPIMDLPNRQVPQEFNPNAFLGELSGSIRYSTSSYKCTHIRNPYIWVAQCILACCFFA